MTEGSAAPGPEQLHALRQRRCGPNGDIGPGWVIYHMYRQRRLADNRALTVAINAARRSRRPLLIVETLPCTGPWRSLRHHHFVIQGMRDMARRLVARRSVSYLPAIETQSGELAAMWKRFAQQGALLVADEAPDHPHDDEGASSHTAFVEAGRPVLRVDDQGLLPLRLLVQPCLSAAVFRRHLHRHARAACCDLPPANPLARLRLPPVPAEAIVSLTHRCPPLRWASRHLADPDRALTRLPIDQTIPPVDLLGGEIAALRRLETFINNDLSCYEQRNHPDRALSSGLSPYLRWGHIGTVTILRCILATIPNWDPLRLPASGGARQGFWPLPSAGQEFLDQLLTWRELGQHAMARLPNFTNYQGIPTWARTSLDGCCQDPRPARYSSARLEAADSGDPIWNAAQRQLLQEGVIHNYLRMLWGKNLLLWTDHPAAAYDILVDLNNRYALDGCDPNSWSGIAWCFGLFDHPWPARPIYGQVRCMTSASTRRKLSMGEYLHRFA